MYYFCIDVSLVSPYMPGGMTLWSHGEDLGGVTSHAFDHSFVNNGFWSGEGDVRVEIYGAPDEDNPNGRLLAAVSRSIRF